jgi:hypothetical protein
VLTGVSGHKAVTSKTQKLGTVPNTGDTRQLTRGGGGRNGSGGRLGAGAAGIIGALCFEVYLQLLAGLSNPPVPVGQPVGPNPGPVAPSLPTDPANVKVVVELGIGGNILNLIKLALYYPNAVIYGIEGSKGMKPLVDGALQGSSFSSRIEVIEADYTTYDDPMLLNQADVVVSIAPTAGYRKAAIDQGIERFIKNGGTVDILFDGNDTTYAESISKKYDSKMGKVFRRLGKGTWTGEQELSYAFVYEVNSLLGVNFSSVHFYTGAHELYIPSW